MAWRSLIERQVQSAMKILGTGEDGLARAQTYVETKEGSYDPSTRRVIREEVLHPDVPMVLAKFSIEDMDSEVKPVTDRKVIIASNDLSIKPTEDDLIILTDASVYNVRRLMSDPADAAYILHVRNTGEKRIANQPPTAADVSLVFDVWARL